MKELKTNDLLIRPAIKEDSAAIREFLLESSSFYPGIELWWDSRVFPSMQTNRRVVLVVEAKNAIEGLFIGKSGKFAKICTLRLRETVRNRGVGRALITEGLTSILTPNAARCHVTISEAAEQGCVPFFESIGFRQAAVIPNRYKKGVDEFVYSCARQELSEVLYNELAEGLDRTLYGAIPVPLAKEQTLVMSLRPEFAAAILEQKKTIELRRKFSKKYEGATIIFYITHPVQQFMFTARISHVDHAPKKQLWMKYQGQCHISQQAFSAYFSGTSFGYAIHLTDVRLVPKQLRLEHAKKACPALRPPQSFQRLEAKSPLRSILELPVHI